MQFLGCLCVYLFDVTGIHDGELVSVVVWLLHP